MLVVLNIFFSLCNLYIVIKYFKITVQWKKNIRKLNLNSNIYFRISQQDSVLYEIFPLQ